MVETNIFTYLLNKNLLQVKLLQVEHLVVRNVISTYRANPIQNIQQLLEYANVDNTIYDFLDKMSDQFMNAIPETLATGVSKRNLIKNIKDLYGAKGTSKGHELFFKAFLGETTRNHLSNSICNEKF